MVKKRGQVKWRKLRTQLRRAAKRLPWRRIAILMGIWVFGTVMIAQLGYPADRLLPLQKVDGLAVGARSKANAIAALDAAYASKKIDVYLGDSQGAVASPTLEQAGMSVDSASRVEAMKYPWYMRLVPTSIFWATSTSGVPKVATSAKSDEFITTELCRSPKRYPEGRGRQTCGRTR